MEDTEFIDWAHVAVTHLARRSRAALRFAKAAVSVGMRRHFAADLSHGMGLEGSGHWVDGGIKEQRLCGRSPPAARNS